MLPVSAGYLSALASPQQVTFRADSDRAGTRLHTGLPIVGGYVDVDASSITRRRLTLELAPRLRTGTYTDIPTLPTDPDHPLGNCGQEITVQHGLTFTDGSTEWVPVGVFRIDSAPGSLFDDEVVTVVGVSREAHVADARFWSPYTDSSPSAQSLIAKLIHQALPSVEVVARASMDRRVPRTTWDEDRWGAITELAQSIAAVVYADPYGRFVIQDAPTVDTAPVWTAKAGSGGVLVSGRGSSSRDRVYNAVVVTGESASSDAAPVVGVAFDNTVGSPTRYGDPHTAGFWGRRPRRMYLPTVTTTEQAIAIARADLAKFTGAAATVDASSVPNAALEALDVVDIITDPSNPSGTVHRHIVDTFQLPLVAGGGFPMFTRDLRDTADV